MSASLPPCACDRIEQYEGYCRQALPVPVQGCTSRGGTFLFQHGMAAWMWQGEHVQRTRPSPAVVSDEESGTPNALVVVYAELVRGLWQEMNADE